MTAPETTLYIDTAASGMWKWDKDKSYPGQPHLIRLAWGSGVHGTEHCVLIPAQTTFFEEDAQALHGIMPFQTRELGITPADALGQLRADLAGKSLVLGFSWDFHRRLIEKAVVELGWDPLRWPEMACAMRLAAPVVKVGVGRNGQHKWPSMKVAYHHFSGVEFERAPDPIEAGIAQINAVRLIHEGIVDAKARAA